MSEHETSDKQREDVSVKETPHAEEAPHGRAGGHATATAPPQPLFDPEELAQFDSDDTLAGSHIGKMLAFFFLYTVIVMSIVVWWTYR